MRKHILVIEENLHNSYLYIKHLRGTGEIVHVMPTIQEANDYLLNYRVPDIVILGMNLVGEGASELLMLLSQPICWGTQVVLSSGGDFRKELYRSENALPKSLGINRLHQLAYAAT